MAGGPFRQIAKRWPGCALAAAVLVIAAPQSQAQTTPRAAAHSVEHRSETTAPRSPRGLSLKSLGLGNSRSKRQQILDELPLDRLTQQARQEILSIAKSPTIYRRLPSQAINCDQDMLLFLVRNPEVLVGIWDLMGITKVKTKRIGPYQLQAEDGSGTHCQVDLVYGDRETHIFVATGNYDGKLVTKPILGQGVFILHTNDAQASDGSTTVAGTLDCFIQLDSLGADLVARTLSGLIGRSADNNFVETARFVAQISQAAEKNPSALIEVTQRMPQVPVSTKRRFADVITTVARRAESRPRSAASPERTASDRTSPRHRSTQW